MTISSGPYGRERFTQEEWDRIIADPHAAHRLFNDRNFDKEGLSPADSAALVNAAAEGVRLKSKEATVSAAEAARAKASVGLVEPSRVPARTVGGHATAKSSTPTSAATPASAAPSARPLAARTTSVATATTSAPTIKLVAGPSAPGFPPGGDEPVKGSNADLNDSFGKLLAKKRSYADPPVRKLYLRFSIEANRRGVMAPAFRKRPSLPMKDVNAEQALISNDRQLLDLHWLHCRRHSPKRCRPPLAVLFEKDDFDFDLAMSLVATNIRTIEKADMLGLTLEEELCLASLRRKQARDEAKKIDQRVLAFQRRLFADGGQHADVAHRWSDLARALEIASASARHPKRPVAKPKGSTLIRLYRWISGDEHTGHDALRKQFGKVRRRLEEL